MTTSPSLSLRVSLVALMITSACARGSTSTSESQVEHSPQPPPPMEVASESHLPELDAPDRLAGPPPRLSILGEGRCRHLGSSVVEGDVYLHYETVVGRLEGGAVRVMPASADDISGLALAVVGSSDELFLRFDRGERREGPWVDHGWWNGQVWQTLAIVPSSHVVVDMWPWGTADWLGFACTPWTCEVQRLMVARGPGKGPHLSRLGCHAPRVVDVFANVEGHAFAALQCGDSGRALWVAHWEHPDRDGSAQRVRTAPFTDSSVDWNARIVADAQGNAWLSSATWRGEAEAAVHVWRGDTWSEAPLPETREITDLQLDPTGKPWLVGDGKIYRHEGGETWQAETLPVEHLAYKLRGVEVGQAWAILSQRGGYEPSDATLWSRRRDGSWVNVELPPAVFVADRTPIPTEMHVAGPDDLVIDAWYPVRVVGRHQPRRYRAVLTSRPVEQPLRCGEIFGHATNIRGFAPWPPAPPEACQSRIVLTHSTPRWTNAAYDTTRRKLVAAKRVRDATVVEMEMAGLKLVGIRTSSAESAEAVAEIAQKIHKWHDVETICGDEATLERAGAKVVREIALKDAT